MHTHVHRHTSAMRILRMALAIGASIPTMSNSKSISSKLTISTLNLCIAQCMHAMQWERTTCDYNTHIPAPTAYYPMCTSYTIIYSIQRGHESGVWVGRCRRCVSGAGLQLAAQPLHLAISDRAWCVNCQHSVDTAVEASLKCKQVR